MIKVLVPLAEGVEEMEAVIVVDVLRRAQWHVCCAGLVPGVVKASRGVFLQPDTTWDKIDPASFDLIMIPGGMEGTRRLMVDTRVLMAVKNSVAAGRWVGAVCAGPLVLQVAGVLGGHKMTCHPGVSDQLTAVQRLPDRVVVDKPFITSQGPGTCFEFALTAIRLLESPEKAHKVAEGLLLPSAMQI